MTEKAKILYVCQELVPYMPENYISSLCRSLPQIIQEKGKDIRIFMPRFGIINERRNQLHEVIRLSGMNIIIDDSDHQLIIKVASIPTARVQVYFIDNDDFFNRKNVVTDNNGKYFDDNDERALFFSRGVIETVSKLRWSPDIIHCHSWFSAIMPAYIKSKYKGDPLFCNSKIVISLYNDDFSGELNNNLINKMKSEGIETNFKDIKSPTFINLMKFAISYADGVIVADENVNNELLEYVNELGIKVIKHNDDTYGDDYSLFYDDILSK